MYNNKKTICSGYFIKCHEPIYLMLPYYEIRLLAVEIYMLKALLLLILELNRENIMILLNSVRFNKDDY